MRVLVGRRASAHHTCGHETPVEFGPRLRQLARQRYVAELESSPCQTCADRPLLAQAFADWLANRAYWCQAGGYGSSKGYYRLKASDTERNRAAPWSALVKRTYPDCEHFHRAARAAQLPA